MRLKCGPRPYQQGASLLVLIFILLIGSISLLMLSQRLELDSRALVQQKHSLELFWAQQTAIELALLTKPCLRASRANGLSQGPDPSLSVIQPKPQPSAAELDWQIEGVDIRLQCRATQDGSLGLTLVLEHQTSDLATRVMRLNGQGAKQP